MYKRYSLFQHAKLERHFILHSSNMFVEITFLWMIQRDKKQNTQLENIH